MFFQSCNTISRRNADPHPARLNVIGNSFEDVIKMPKKIRIEIPVDISAKTLFESDRTCCICHQKKPVQIHHIDENPANNEPKNLAVLCLDCHHDTQIRGGFGRKLDAEQVRLYRDDWLGQVRRQRLVAPPEESETGLHASTDVREVAARLEIHKAAEHWFRVAQIYDEIGDVELRDKYIDLTLKGNPNLFERYGIARMQGTTTDLSQELIAATLEDVGKDWTWRAAILKETGNISQAAVVYLEGIRAAIERGAWFNAAFYIRHALNGEIADMLFLRSLRESAEEGDLWWQLRAFEELGWNDAKRELLLGNESKIQESGEPHLMEQLAKAKGDAELALKAAKELAEEDAQKFREAAEEGRSEGI
jgi:hypothetical protein